MKFSLISDMHVDFPQPKTPYDKFEEVIIVAGDTSNGLEGLKFLQKLKNKGHKVWACDGNHEHYRNLSQNREVYETTARFREDHKASGMIAGEIPIILRCGWYAVSDEELWKGYMNDSRNCMLSAFDVNHLAYTEARYIQQTLEEWKKWQLKGVVVTHMAPCEETLNPEFEGHFSNEWYFNPHMRQIMKEYSDQILVWCHGHTHAANEAVVEGVRVVCNPRGYPGENPKWEPLTIEV